MKKGNRYTTINGKRFPVLDRGSRRYFLINRIVSKLADMACKRGYSLTEIKADWRNGLYTKAEMQELLRLLGFSVDGFAEVFPRDKVGR